MSKGSPLPGKPWRVYTAIGACGCFYHHIFWGTRLEEKHTLRTPGSCLK